MELIPCDKKALNAIGLAKYPWIIQDPENVRYIIDVAHPFLIKDKDRVIGFIVKRDLKGQPHIDYQIFCPLVTDDMIFQYCRTCLPKEPVSIITYDTHFLADVSKKSSDKSYPPRLQLQTF